MLTRDSQSGWFIGAWTLVVALFCIGCGDGATVDDDFGGDFGDDEITTFDTFDDDGDLFVDEGEFADGLIENGIFGDFDDDVDDFVNGNEFSDEVFTLIDDDLDGELTDDEFATGVNDFFADPASLPGFGDLDLDEDGILTEDEFAPVDDDVFGGFDADDDKQLTSEELGVGLFDEFDADDDDLLTEDEFFFE